MDLSEMFARMPYNDHLGIELLEAEDGYAVGELELSQEHSSNPNQLVAHGGVAYSLADTVGGAAVMSANFTVTPTINMRMDYLAPATGGTLRAEAEVIRNGDSVATVSVDVTDEDGTDIATARGTYKTGGGDDGSAWRGEEAE
ncbi:PaaI family thioesterase [Natronomonas halophila]|uniref:PaaI family thioesterase n=1 Tax=Natronomonas halophila TaxID=2747817 RepID=UPI0015B53072|nr:PaaI family thioesterase [Natronomonas halophila]QLD85450.1 PaaI family thioesterase [Natronomonas halophila]